MILVPNKQNIEDRRGSTMKRTLLTVSLIASVVASAQADPFTTVSASGYYDYTVSTQAGGSTGGSSNSGSYADYVSFGLGGGDSSSLYNNWTEWDPDQYMDIYYTEYAEASANSYMNFSLATNEIDAEVYANSSSNSWYSGPGTSASAYANANASTTVNFTLLASTPAFISSVANFGNAYLEMTLNGAHFTSSTEFTGSYFTILPAGNYQIYGSASGGGGAHLGVQAVPEPTTCAALGLGAAALLRRRRK